MLQRLLFDFVRACANSSYIPTGNNPARRHQPFRNRPYFGICGALIPYLVLIAMVVVVTPRPAAASSLPAAIQTPADLALLMNQATVFVNHHQLDKLFEISTENARKAEDWARTSTTRWTVEALATPQKKGVEAATSWLAVFHCWHSCETDGDHIYRLEHRATGWIIGDEIPETDPGGYRIRDHQMHITADITGRSIHATDRIKVERLGDTRPDYLLMHLSEDYHVRQITSSIGAEAEAPIPFTQVGGVITLIAPEGKDPNFSLTLDYSGELSHGDGDFVHSDEVSLASYWYPTIARLPATSTVTTEAPKGWTVVAQGELTTEAALPAGGKLFTYTNSVPVSYFSLDMGRYAITTRMVAGCKLSVYLLDADPGLAGRCLDITAAAMKFYNANFGPFPYTRYGIVQSHWVTEMALEAYSFATFGPHGLPGLIPHELSHTWWGGVVDNTYLHSMWNEAFADYSDGLFTRMTSSARRQNQEGLFREYRSIGHQYDAASIANAFDTLNNTMAGIGYDKGSRVLRVLEDELGQQTMLRCVAAFYKGHAVGEPIEWSDFEAVVNKTTGKDYRWFFAQWLERPGLPMLRLDRVTVDQRPDGRFLTADVLQSGAPYRLSLEIAVRNADGKETIQTYQVNGARTHIEIPVDSLPINITLNPLGTIPLCPVPDGDADTDYTTFTFRR